jgi:hypothetical protein
LGAWIQAQKTDPLTAAHQRVFQRNPSPREREMAQRFVAGRESLKEVWSQYAQALLAANEVMFVD